MATTEDIARLIVEAKTTGLTQVEAELKGLHTRLEQTKKDFTDQKIGLDDYIKAQEKISARTSQLVHAFDLGSTGSAKIGHAALEASRALEDLQYGFAGVVNNIPGFVQAIGGPAGAVAAISLIGVAINQLIKHKDEVMKLFDSPSWGAFTKQVGDSFGRMIAGGAEFKTRLGEIEQTIKELSEKKIKTVFEQQALDGAKELAGWIERAQKASEALAGAKSKAQVTAGKMVTEAVEEVPGGAAKLQAQMVDAAQKMFEKQSAPLQHMEERVRDIQEKIKHAVLPESIRFFLRPELEKRQAELAGERQRIREQATTYVGEAFRGAQAGETRRVEQFAGLAEAVGQGPLATIVRGAPGAQKFADEAELARATEQSRKSMEERVKEEKESWNKAGKVIESITKPFNDALWDIMKARDDASREAKEKAEKAVDRDIKRSHDWVVEGDKRDLERKTRLSKEFYGKRAEAMAEEGLMGGMSQQQVFDELMTRMRNEGVGRQAARETVTEAMNTAVAKMIELQNRTNDLMSGSGEMMRYFSDMLRQTEEKQHKFYNDMMSAQQSAMKTGGP